MKSATPKRVTAKKTRSKTSAKSGARKTTRRARKSNTGGGALSFLSKLSPF